MELPPLPAGAPPHGAPLNKAPLSLNRSDRKQDSDSPPGHRHPSPNTVHFQGHRSPSSFIVKVTPVRGSPGDLFSNHLLLLSLAISRKSRPWSWEIAPLETFLFAVERILFSRLRPGTLGLWPTSVRKVLLSCPSVYVKSMAAFWRGWQVAQL